MIGVTEFVFRHLPERIAQGIRHRRQGERRRQSQLHLRHRRRQQPHRRLIGAAQQRQEHRILVHENRIDPARRKRGQSFRVARRRHQRRPGKCWASGDRCT